jgi:hypothetical protein
LGGRIEIPHRQSIVRRCKFGGNVRFGSLADIRTARGHVCFTLESGHVRCN